MMIISISLIFIKAFNIIDISSLSVFISVALTTIGVVILFFKDEEDHFLILFLWLFMSASWAFYAYLEFNKKQSIKDKEKIEVVLKT